MHIPVFGCISYTAQCTYLYLVALVILILHQYTYQCTPIPIYPYTHIPIYPYILTLWKNSGVQMSLNFIEVYVYHNMNQDWKNKMINNKYLIST